MDLDDNLSSDSKNKFDDVGDEDEDDNYENSQRWKVFLKYSLPKKHRNTVFICLLF